MSQANPEFLRKYNCGPHELGLVKRETGGILDLLFGIMFLLIAGTGLLNYALTGESVPIGVPQIAFYGVLGTTSLLTRYSERVRRRVRSIRENLHVQVALALFAFALAGLFFMIGGHLGVLIFGTVFVIVGLEIIYNLIRYEGLGRSSAE